MGFPRLILTGASGFLGRHLLQAAQARARVFAMARRSPAVSDAPTGGSITWLQCDIGDGPSVRAAFDAVRQQGGADVLLHLAGHYDFTGRRHPDYVRANVVGMRHVLEAAARIGVPHVVFTSSVAACQFPPLGRALTETSPPDGDTPYAESKRLGEAMLGEFAGAFHAVIVRLAAIYSDWCEYEPLFRFLERWLGASSTRRVLPGWGWSAVPYLHVRDAIDLLLLVAEDVPRFPAGTVLLGSPDGATTHRELFEAATAAHYGQRASPLLLPRPLCRAGIVARLLAGQLTGSVPFERLWMARMIDRWLLVDARRSRELAGWAPRARLDVLRRMPFLVEHRKTYPGEWHRRNHAALSRVRRHDNLRIHQLIEARESSIQLTAAERLQAQSHAGLPGTCLLRSLDQLDAQNRLLLEELMMSVRTGEKGIFLEACRDLAARWREHGAQPEDVCAGLEALREACLGAVRAEGDGAAWNQALHDHITMTFRFGEDGVLEEFEHAGLHAADQGPGGR